MTIHEQTLRDQYAGLAMQAILQSEDQMDAALILADKITMDNEKVELQDAISMMAYAQAESMIKIRRRIEDTKKEERDGKE